MHITKTRLACATLFMTTFVCAVPRPRHFSFNGQPRGTSQDGIAKVLETCIDGALGVEFAKVAGIWSYELKTNETFTPMSSMPLLETLQRISTELNDQQDFRLKGSLGWDLVGQLNTLGYKSFEVDMTQDDKYANARDRAILSGVFDAVREIKDAWKSVCSALSSRIEATDLNQLLGFSCEDIAAHLQAVMDFYYKR
ncbi:hypothetical protein IE81DRAFT_332672 [Ceraceosorus guamensis]|uniref:Uncharacterized protein n=1 Tax=Ceraceosorus guamensis TaxID=1522189 RepID=A0A316VRC6_9BASI|nr:hypothetical protein IE81DRAFT_332672 [Ceraceosorus guamensis]PWN38953.1 hypothetical protein IE81DRAFT_332672 [Ceraceosorus guamensis]